MTIQEANKQLIFQLYHIYDDREAANIADLVMEHVTEWKKIDRIINKQVVLSATQQELIKKYTSALLTHKPVQYVLNEAWFCGMKLFVNENVLIPRPETEELVDWVVRDLNNTQQGSSLTTYHSQLAIMDVGTGSGCIPIALKKKLPGAQVYACDVSETALEISKKNAVEQKTDIDFLQMNFLDATQWQELPSFNIIVSNPPYVPINDKNSMKQNVLDYEPHLALFVENNDPLVFYKAIAEFGNAKLLAGGTIYVEIHEDLSEAVKRVFLKEGYETIEVRKDLQGKDRMVKVKSEVRG